MQHSYYGVSIDKFLTQSVDEILGALSVEHHFALEESQRDAWRAQIVLLKSELNSLSEGYIHFEFIIPRMGKRADCVLVYKGVIFVIEFKVGSHTFDRYAVSQVHDYALDLKNFHLGSHHARIVPILIATKAYAEPQAIEYAPDHVAEPLKAGPQQLLQIVQNAVAGQPIGSLNHACWVGSGYRPTPTIIEAARTLYAEHQVDEISYFDAGAKNLVATNSYVANVIEQAKLNHSKAICFITGVPGAGKTLAGLNIAAHRAEHPDEHAVFLSGNGPLVAVLREALARDQTKREKIKKTDADRKVSSFIQNIHHFRDHYLRDNSAPVEKVVVFDEAQRAWTREQASKFMQQKRGQESFNSSEPDFLIGVMDRHEDWCVVVCLIGGGQEINTGEAGLGEWLQALKNNFSNWDVHASSQLAQSDYTIEPAARKMLEDRGIHKQPDLHLAVSMRSFRAETLNRFVTAFLNGAIKDAHDAYSALAERYPIYVTRDLGLAREWLRDVARGSERYGLVASSGALRLRPEGVSVKVSLDAENWFLNDRDDVRSSYYLEEVATEFDVQGLELDWACLAWDADLRWGVDRWQMYNFRGTKWQKVQAEARQRYLVNAYRVLLTRARQGMVIYVPYGDNRDATRPAGYYDATYHMMLACGLPQLVL